MNFWILEDKRRIIYDRWNFHSYAVELIWKNVWEASFFFFLFHNPSMKRFFFRLRQLYLRLQYVKVRNFFIISFVRWKILKIRKSSLRKNSRLKEFAVSICSPVRDNKPIFKWVIRINIQYPFDWISLANDDDQLIHLTCGKKICVKVVHNFLKGLKIYSHSTRLYNRNMWKGGLLSFIRKLITHILRARSLDTMYSRFLTKYLTKFLTMDYWFQLSRVLHNFDHLSNTHLFLVEI